MQKRFLAILAMIAVTFAFGIGAALAAPPDGRGGGDEKSSADKCEQSGGKAEGCENHPGGGDDDDDGGTPGCDDLPAETPQEIRDFCEALEGGGTPTLPDDPTGVCDLLRSVAAPLGDACDAVVALLTGEGGGGEDPPAPTGDCSDLAPFGQEAVDACQQLVDAIGGGGGGEEPPGEEPPGEEPPGGEQPGCADLPAETPQEIVDFCEALESGELPAPPSDPTGLCDVLRGVAAPLGDVCDAVVALLDGEAPSPDGFDCSTFEPLGAEAVAGCEAFLDTVGGGELPAPPGGGGEPSCADIPDATLADGCQQLVDALTGAGLPV